MNRMVKIIEYLKNKSGGQEWRWDTKLYNEDYPSFKIEDIYIITPLCYRHYKIFHEQIDYIKNHNKIQSGYIENGFYRLKMIYNEINYQEYVKEECEEIFSR